MRKHKSFIETRAHMHIKHCSICERDRQNANSK